MPKLIDHIPNIILINENNDHSKFHDLIKGKTIILNMFYSNCKIKCQPLGKLLRKVNILLNKYIVKNNIYFISITLDAENDTINDLIHF